MIPLPTPLTGTHPLAHAGRYDGGLVVVSWRWSGPTPWGVTAGVHRLYTVRHQGGRRTWEVTEAELVAMLGRGM